MKKFIATSAFAAITFSSFGQLADMISLPEGMEEPTPSFSEQELLMTWGWLLSERFTLKDLELSQQELDWIAEGMAKHVQGEELVTDLRESQMALQAYFSQREVTIRERQLEANRRKGEEFFDSLFGKPGMLSLATGLFYEIQEPGNEKKPSASDTVLVKYVGTFLDGTEFDSTDEKGPISFKLNDVIPAWTQGIPLLGEGGKIKLYVPSKLGYGNEGRPGIPPASTLIFEVELISVGVPGSPAPVPPAPAAQ